VRYAIFLIALLALPMQTQAAIERVNNLKDFWVSTPYPALEVSAEEPVHLSVSVHNKSDLPRLVNVSVEQVPTGWKASLLGDGKPVSAVFVSPDNTSDLKLHLTPPATAKAGTYRFVVKSTAEGVESSLPVQIKLGDKAPPKITLQPEFPDLRGAPDSEFTFKLALKNESAQDALIGLEALAPSGFQATFNKEYGSQQITSMPVKAASSENIEVKIKPSQGIKADTYKVRVRARTEKAEALTDLTLAVTGQPELSLTGLNDRISGKAHAGEETPVKLILANNGTAPARNVELGASEPSGWKIKFDQQKIAQIAPGEQREVQALITPSSQAVAGDYMVTLKANGDSVSKSSDYRVTVATSTMWGAVGVAVIACALLVLTVAMMRFGRR